MIRNSKVLFLLICLHIIKSTTQVLQYSNTTAAAATGGQLKKCHQFSDHLMQKMHKCQNCCGDCENIRCCQNDEPIVIDAETCARYNNQGKANFLFILLILGVLVIILIVCYCFYDYKTKNTDELITTMQSFISIVQTQNQMRPEPAQGQDPNGPIQPRLSDLPPPYSLVSSTTLAAQYNLLARNARSVTSGAANQAISRLSNQISIQNNSEAQTPQIPVIINNNVGPEINIIASRQSVNIVSTTNETAAGPAPTATNEIAAAPAPTTTNETAATPPPITSSANDPTNDDLPINPIQ